MSLRSSGLSRGSLKRNSNGMAPMMAIHKIHVRGGTRNSPLFLVSLLSSAMALKNCVGNYHPHSPTATRVYTPRLVRVRPCSYINSDIPSFTRRLIESSIPVTNHESDAPVHHLFNHIDRKST